MVICGSNMTNCGNVGMVVQNAVDCNLDANSSFKAKAFYVFVLVAVNFICDHPAIKAISFVGSNQAGEYIYERGSKNGKRVQSNMVIRNASLNSLKTTTLMFKKTNIIFCDNSHNENCLPFWH